MRRHFWYGAPRVGKLVSYVNSVLQAGELVIQVARFHWIIYLRPLVFGVVCAVLLYLAARERGGTATVFDVAGGISGLFSIAWFIRAWFRGWTTELAITNRRVIYKRGFIWRQTTEMNMSKVETVVVEQTLLGRLLNYGTVHIRGTGQSIEHLRFIAAPLNVRNAVTAR
jgi:hypothetical protein